MANLRNKKKKLSNLKKKRIRERCLLRRKQGLTGFDKDFAQEDFGDLWLSCQADVNKLVEIKQHKIKSNVKQAKPRVKNESVDDKSQPTDDQVQPICKIELNVDQTMDFKDSEGKPIDDIYKPIIVKHEEDKAIDEIFIDVIKDEEDQVIDEIYTPVDVKHEEDEPIDEFHKTIDVKDSEYIPKRNAFSERFSYEITSCPPPVVVAEASCSGCLARGAHEEMAGLLVECFGIKVPGAVLCGACAARLRDALHFKWTVLANQRHFDERQRRTADVSAQSLSLVVTPLVRPAEETRCESEQNSDEHSEGVLFFTSRNNLSPNSENEKVVITPKIKKSKKTLTPEIQDPEIGEAIKTPKIKKSKKTLTPVIQDPEIEEPIKTPKIKKSNKTLPPGILDSKRLANLRAVKLHYTRLGDSYACNDCEAIVDFDNTATHRYNYHGQVKCTLCPLTYRTKKLLFEHKIKEHGVDDNKCNVCDKRFIFIKNHMNNFHRLGDRLKCDQCDFECYDKIRLSKHMRKHKPTKDYQCKYCSKRFRHGTNLNFHERIHTGDKRKVCAECGQAFVQKASLNYHMAKHHPSVPF